MALVFSAAAAATAFFLQAAATTREAPAAKEAPAAAAPAPVEGRKQKDGRICRAEPVLGSRLPITLCATADQWEARRQNDKETLDKIQHGLRNPNPEAGP